MATEYSSSFLAVYGSLRRRSLVRRGLLVARNLSFFGHGILRGRLFVQNGYPGAIEGPGAIQVEIFRVSDQAVFQVLDLYEGFSPDLSEYSLFYRKVVRLLHPEILATAYFLARQTPKGEKVLTAKCPSRLVGSHLPDVAGGYVAAFHDAESEPSTRFFRSGAP
jgi:gamma-glutamylcyclotransferase (GGCT)/AIG2-like uncharacterized protein YtfP